MACAFVRRSDNLVKGSSSFFADILRQHTELVEFLDDGCSGERHVALQEIEAAGFEQIFVWHMADVAAALARLVPERVVFIPMWDACSHLQQEFWGGLGRIRILSFCWALHQRLREWGQDSFHAQYFPDPAKFQQVTDFSALRGYLAQRTQQIGWREARMLSGGHRWEKFWLDIGMDPAYGECEPPSTSDIHAFNIEIARFAGGSEATAADLRAANVHFASRLEEGGGASFLEAMARGQCVLAPDVPTMSEYITNGVSGILYDPKKLTQQPLCRAREMGGNARYYVETGYEDWCFDRSERLPTLLFERHANLSLLRTRGQAEWARPALKSVKRTRAEDRPTEADGSDSTLPKVTVAIVTYNAGDSFAETFRSIEEQTYQNIEIVVVDGASSDNTPRLIRERQEHIHRWISKKDNGPYDAMNKAAQIGTGKFIIYMNAGDRFYNRTALSRAMSSAPAGTDFIFGHHIYLAVSGSEEYHKALNFEETWQALKAGDFSLRWLSGIPCHQATLTRRSLLIEAGGYDLNYKIAADHEFMYRMRALGAKFHHCGHVVAIYAGGGLSATRTVECVQDWWRLARRLGPPSKADAFFRRNFPRKCELRPWTLGALWRRAKRPLQNFSKLLERGRRRASRVQLKELPPNSSLFDTATAVRTFTDS